jgi:transformation/transcription domain-associated protein
MLQQPLMEVPAQYACQERSPALDQHALVERFQAAVGVHLDRASGETTRIITLRADDGTSHSFALRRAPLRRPHAPLGHERMGQLARLLNARLLGAREARRRSLVVHVPACVRLGGGLSLVASGAVPRLSLTSALALSSALAGAQSDASQSSQSVHATALAHQRALARAPPAEEPRARQERLREAFQDAISATPEDALSRALYGCAPSAGVLWDLQRRITSQLGLHALLTHALQLSATLPETIVLRRDTGAVELLEFTSFGAGASPKDVVPIDEVPFRLTRTLQQFITPLGIDGPFSGAFCAAAECLANQNKCPLPQWLDALARREGGPSGGDPDDTASAALAQGLVPWGCSGLKAAERVQNLSPVLLARSAAGNRPMADVHAKVRSLIDAATNTDNLCAMPSGWMAWL